MDTQQKRVYRWEEGPAMAGADPYIIERVAEESTLTYQAFLRGEWEPTGRGGTAREPRYNRKPQMTLREAQALVDRICRDYGVEPIPVVDGDAPFRLAMMRFRKEGNGPVLQHADGRDFIVDLVIPPWTRNVWVVAHEVSHYLTYRFFPPTHENHGPEFVGCCWMCWRSTGRTVGTAGGPRQTPSGERSDGRPTCSPRPPPCKSHPTGRTVNIRGFDSPAPAARPAGVGERKEKRGRRSLTGRTAADR